MREIKFRCWVRRHNESDYEMVYLLPPTCINGDQIDHCIGDYGVSREPAAWMQFTGLKDKNGVEIYEGDVIRFIGQQGDTCVREVEFDEGAFCVNMNDYWPACAYWPQIAELGEIEVIGNIRQNPELLKT